MIPIGYLPDTYWYHEIFLIKNQNQQILCCVMSLVVGITGIGPALSPYSSNARRISRYLTHIISESMF